MKNKDKISILYDAQVLSYYDINNSGRTGVFFVAYNVLKELAKYPFLEISLDADINMHNALKRMLFERAEDFPNITIYDGNKKDFHLYFSPFNEISKKIKSSKISCYTIAHDLIPLLFPEKHNADVQGFYFHKLVASWTYDDYFFANSNYTKSDLIKHLPKLDPNKITATLLAAGESFYQDLNKDKHIKIREKYNIPKDKKYIFSLCTLGPRKNLIFSIKNFIEFIENNNIDDLVFVLGGGHWEAFMQELLKETDSLDKYKSKIIKAGYVDDKDLASLYSNAQCSVYTSIYEGFGLPPLEAMQCGCPVITSNVSSLPEVVGDAGIMIDPSDNLAMVKAYEKLYFDNELRLSFIEKGLARAKLFSWGKCVKIMVDTFLKNSDIPRKIKMLKLKKYYLFGVIPYLIIKNQKNRMKIKFLGIPLFKITKNEHSKKYYLLNFIRIYKNNIRSENKFNFKL